SRLRHARRGEQHVMEDVDAAEHAVGGGDRERDPTEHAPREPAPKAAHAGIAYRESESSLVHDPRRASDLVQREVGAAIELHEGAHQLARVASDAGRVRDGREVIDADAHAGDLVAWSAPGGRQAGRPFFATCSIASLNRSISSSVVYTAGDMRSPWNSC